MLLSPSPTYPGIQAGKACDYSGVSSFAVAVVEYTLTVILHILRVDWDDKGTGYTDGSLTVTLVSWDASRQGLLFSGLTVMTKELDTVLIPSPSPAYQGVLEFSGGGGTHSCGYTPHLPSWLGRQRKCHVLSKYWFVCLFGSLSTGRTPKMPCFLWQVLRGSRFLIILRFPWNKNVRWVPSPYSPEVMHYRDSHFSI
jgi:hypothetical protein